MSELKKVTILGLGSMGSVLAALLIKKGHRVTVWNRTRSKEAKLVEIGAHAAADVAAAVSASDIIIVSLATHSDSREVLENRHVEEALSGKTLIQLSTGTPNDAKADEVWANKHDIKLLDGAIMVTPGQMGTPEAFVLVAGSSDVYADAEDVLKVLAINTLYTGEKIHSSSALDLAFLSYFFSALIGFTHAARIAQAEGLDIASFGTMVQNWSPVIGSIIKECSTRVAAGHFENPQSTVQTCYFSTELISRHAQEAGISDLFPAFATSVFKKGMDAGLGSEDGAAIFKILN